MTKREMTILNEICKQAILRDDFIKGLKLMEAQAYLIRMETEQLEFDLEADESDICVNVEF